MNIILSTNDDAELIAHIIKVSNQDVADTFNITQDNNPKHPSFYTKEWVLADLERGEAYFLYKKPLTINTERREGNIGNRSDKRAEDSAVSHIQGCVAIDMPRPGVAYLNRLSVLPEYRHRGVGEQLVKFVVEYAQARSVNRVSIGIIDEHTLLKQWYVKLGFVEGDRKSFDHLPFAVRYMSYIIPAL